MLGEEERARLPAESLSWLVSDADEARNVKAATVEEATASSSGSGAEATTLVALARGKRLLCVHLFGAKKGQVRGTYQHSGPADITSVRWVALQGGADGPRLVAGREDGCLLFLDRHCSVVFESRLHFAPIVSIQAHQTRGLTVVGRRALTLVSKEELVQVFGLGEGGGRRRGLGRANSLGRALAADFGAAYDLSAVVSGRLGDAMAIGGPPAFDMGRQLMRIGDGEHYYLASDEVGGDGGGNGGGKVRVLMGGSAPTLVSMQVEMKEEKVSLLSAALEALPLVGRLRKKFNGSGGAARPGSADEDELNDGVIRLTARGASAVPFFDPKREVLSMVASPDHRLVACTDNLGRILILDAVNFVVTRVLKGYRDASLAWASGYLVILAPKRARIEAWDVFRGRKIKHVGCEGGGGHVIFGAPGCTVLTKALARGAGGASHVTKLAFSADGLTISDLSCPVTNL